MKQFLLQWFHMDVSRFRSKEISQKALYYVLIENNRQETGIHFMLMLPTLFAG